MTLSKTTSPDRRAFLRSLSVAVLGGSTLSVAGCRTEESEREAGGASGEASTLGTVGSRPGLRPAITRPVLLPWSEDIVRIAAPSPELPVAYVSRALRRIFVDHDYRDRATWLLDAHISVSTGHWRIRLPGDPPGQPVTPGDALREFEELAMHDWDGSMAPAMDDIRIRRGSRATQRVDFQCVSLAGGMSPTRWYDAGPWDLGVCDGTSKDSTREDFMVMGTGLCHEGRACAQSGEAVQFVTWAIRGD